MVPEGQGGTTFIPLATQVAKYVEKGDITIAVNLLRRSYNRGWHQGHACGRVVEMHKKSIARSLADWVIQFRPPDE